MPLLSFPLLTTCSLKLRRVLKESFSAAMEIFQSWHNNPGPDDTSDRAPPPAEGPPESPASDASAAGGLLDVTLYLPVSLTAILQTMAKIFQTIPRAAH